MRTPSRLTYTGRFVRILRLVAALGVILALVAVATIVKGDAAERSQALVAFAMILGATALLGMAIVAWPYRRKEKNDPRS